MTPTADLCDAHPDVAIVELVLQDYGARRAFAGPIVTVALFEDNSLVREALQEPGQGRVLVVDGGGSRRRALVGDRLAQLAADNGWSGIVVNGCIRDSAVIAGIDIGLKALGTCPRKTEKRGLGRRDVTVRFGGISFEPGNYLYADQDGVLLSAQALHETAGS